VRCNLLEQAISADDGDRAAQIIQHALGIESGDVANYVFPKTWPTLKSHPQPLVCYSKELVALS